MAAGLDRRGGFAARLGGSAMRLGQELVRPARHSRQAEVSRKRAVGWIAAAAAASVVIFGLMLTLDEAVIKAMPPRGTPDLWPVRLFTELGEFELILPCLAGALAILWLWVAIRPDIALARTLGPLAIRISFLLLSVALANLVGHALKRLIGRGRPFVGGEANAFNFHPFASEPRFFSFPSGHALTAFALAAGIAWLWPRAAPVAWTYAVLILISRIVLLAHHPSDVIGGALLGLIITMVVREWFAARGLAFVIVPDGSTRARPGPSWSRLKRVAGVRQRP